MAGTAERDRLAASPDATSPWRLWGPYVAGRQWGTVREDYSADQNAWDSFGFDQAHLRAYRWGEDGIAGVCDRLGFLNLSVALWNGHDDRLKERMFGLTNAQGNHGEDVKEYWWHLDATPTHSYAQYLYRYPQRAFPYGELVRANAERGKGDHEFELVDTGVLDDDRFFDVIITHAKAGPDDLVMEITATNHGPDPAPLWLVPQLFFRNTWSWGRDDRHPDIVRDQGADGDRLVARHAFLGDYHLTWSGDPVIMLCDNETNGVALWGPTAPTAAHPKNAIDQAVVHADLSLLAAGSGTKAGLVWRFDAVPSHATVRVELRLRATAPAPAVETQEVITARRTEADDFYATVIGAQTPAEDALIARRAFAGLMWGKQHYRYDVGQWLAGDPAQPPSPPQRQSALARNAAWAHVALADVISMPDEWEYPWFAAWDLAFHCVALAHVDPAFAKEQLMLLCREWAMHPDGQLPAYEWAFGDVNPPVHAWAAWQVFMIDGANDLDFLAKIMIKLLINLGWWVNRKDPDGSDLFEGGFLGMDNIGLFNRSEPLPAGERLEQSDATSWMAFFELSMLRMAWVLARHDRTWDEIATHFVERFLAIAEAMESFGSGRIALWDEEDGFFYDALVHADGSQERVRVRSLVGLLPLLAVAVRPDWVPIELPDYERRLEWLRRHRPDQVAALLHPAPDDDPTTNDRYTLSLLSPARLERLVTRLLDESEFLSPHGIRSLSASYRDGMEVRLGEGSAWMQYVPGDSDTSMFGGNSNWRGPVWWCINVLLVDALRSYDDGLGSAFEFPTGSGTVVPAGQIADELDERLIGLFRAGADGRRPGTPRDHPSGPLWDPHLTFSEYFHGDTGAGLGASHQTGWTALVAHLILTRRA